MQLRPCVLATLIALTAAARADQAAPPTPISIVRATLTGAHGFVLDEHERFHLLLFEVTGPSKSKVDFSWVVPVPLAADACRQIWFAHRDSDAAEGAALEAEVGHSIEGIPILTTPCGQVARMPGFSAGQVKGAPFMLGAVGFRPYFAQPTDWAALARRRGDDLLPALRRVREALREVPALTLPIAETVRAVGSKAALAMAIELDLGNADDPSWRALPEAFDLLAGQFEAELAVKLRHFDYLEALWQISPTRTLALVQRLFPAHPIEVGLAAGAIRHPRMYDFLLRQYRSGVARPVILGVLAEHVVRGVDDALRDFLMQARHDLGDAGGFDADDVSYDLGVLERRAQLHLGDPAAFVRWVLEGGKHWSLDVYKDALGMRVRIDAVVVWGGQVTATVADATLEIKLERDQEAQQKQPFAPNAQVTVEGIISRVDSRVDGRQIDLELAFAEVHPRAAIAPVPTLPSPPTSARRARNCSCQVAARPAGPWGWLLAAGLLVAWRRRRPGRS